MKTIRELVEQINKEGTHELELRTVKKDEGEIPGITVRTGNLYMCPTFYVDSYDEEITEEGEKNFRSYIDNIYKDAIMQNEKNTKIKNLVDMITNRDKKVLNYLYLSNVNPERDDFDELVTINENGKNYVFKILVDLNSNSANGSITIRKNMDVNFTDEELRAAIRNNILANVKEVLVGENILEDNFIIEPFLGMFKTFYWNEFITNEMLNYAGISKTELQEAAKKHSEDYKIEDISSILNRMFSREGIEEEMPDSGIGMYVASNKKTLLGSACILNTEFLNSVSEKLDADKLVIIPSSIHEVIIIPVREGDETPDPAALREMVASVNENEVMYDEILSYDLYQFIKGTGSIQYLEEDNLESLIS